MPPDPRERTTPRAPGFAVVKAPWTPDQVASLNGCQRNGGFHGFMCFSDDCPRPDGSKQLLVAHHYGWRCPAEGCGYAQDWANGWMADWSWRESAQGLAEVLGAARKAVEAERARAAAVTRFEVIDHTTQAKNHGAAGRAFLAYDIAAELSYQDDGRTLKVFLSDRPEGEPS